MTIIFNYSRHAERRKEIKHAGQCNATPSIDLGNRERIFRAKRYTWPEFTFRDGEAQTCRGCLRVYLLIKYALLFCCDIVETVATGASMLDCAPEIWSSKTYNLKTIAKVTSF